MIAGKQSFAYKQVIELESVQPYRTFAEQRAYAHYICEDSHTKHVNIRQATFEFVQETSRNHLEPELRQCLHLGLQQRICATQIDMQKLNQSRRPKNQLTASAQEPSKQSTKPNSLMSELDTLQKAKDSLNQFRVMFLQNKFTLEPYLVPKTAYFEIWRTLSRTSVLQSLKYNRTLLEKIVHDFSARAKGKVSQQVQQQIEDLLETKPEGLANAILNASEVDSDLAELEQDSTTQGNAALDDQSVQNQQLEAELNRLAALKQNKHARVATKVLCAAYKVHPQVLQHLGLAVANYIHDFQYPCLPQILDAQTAFKQARDKAIESFTDYIKTENLQDIQPVLQEVMEAKAQEIKSLVDCQSSFCSERYFCGLLYDNVDETKRYFDRKQMLIRDVAQLGKTKKRVLISHFLERFSTSVHGVHGPTKCGDCLRSMVNLARTWSVTYCKEHKINIEDCSQKDCEAVFAYLHRRVDALYAYKCKVHQIQTAQVVKSTQTELDQAQQDQQSPYEIIFSVERAHRPSEENLALRITEIFHELIDHASDIVLSNLSFPHNVVVEIGRALSMSAYNSGYLIEEILFKTRELHEQGIKANLVSSQRSIRDANIVLSVDAAFVRYLLGGKFPTHIHYALPSGSTTNPTTNLTADKDAQNNQLSGQGTQPTHSKTINYKHLDTSKYGVLALAHGIDVGTLRYTFNHSTSESAQLYAGLLYKSAVLGKLSPNAPTAESLQAGAESTQGSTVVPQVQAGELNFLIVHSDNSSSMLSYEMLKLVHDNGSLLSTTMPGHPKENSHAERANGWTKNHDRANDGSSFSESTLEQALANASQYAILASNDKTIKEKIYKHALTVELLNGKKNQHRHTVLEREEHIQQLTQQACTQQGYKNYEHLGGLGWFCAYDFIWGTCTSVVPRHACYAIPYCAILELANTKYLNRHYRTKKQILDHSEAARNPIAWKRLVEHDVKLYLETGLLQDEAKVWYDYLNSNEARATQELSPELRKAQQAAEHLKKLVHCYERLVCIHTRHVQESCAQLNADEVSVCNEITQEVLGLMSEEILTAAKFGAIGDSIAQRANHLANSGDLASHSVLGVLTWQKRLFDGVSASYIATPDDLINHFTKQKRYQKSTEIVTDRVFKTTQWSQSLLEESLLQAPTLEKIKAYRSQVSDGGIVTKQSSTRELDAHLEHLESQQNQASDSAKAEELEDKERALKRITSRTTRLARQFNPLLEGNEEVLKEIYTPEELEEAQSKYKREQVQRTLKNFYRQLEGAAEDDDEDDDC